MQYTPNFNLNIVEGTDIVNPMSVDNPNYTEIDTVMYANECNSIGSATELKSGTVHALTRVKANQNVFRFRATARYVAGDTFTVDGNVVTAQLPDGSALADGAYIIGSDVLCALVGTQLTLFVSINNAEQIMYDQNTSVKAYLNSLIVDNLTTEDATKGLSAKQGKVLDDKITGITDNLINTYLTYNATSSAFEFQPGTPEPSLPQLTLVVRNTSNGALYVIWYSNANHNFTIGSIISGSAPANGNNVNVQYFR